MDYEFTYDEYDKPVAKFSSGHEAFGLWFNEELNDISQKINSLLAVIHKLEKFELNQHNIQGREFELYINREQVKVSALALCLEIEKPEDTEFYDQESYAECGFEDFKDAVVSWRKFVSKR